MVTIGDWALACETNWPTFPEEMNILNSFNLRVRSYALLVPFYCP